MHLGNNVKHHRRRLGFTQADFGRVIGKNRAWVANVETGRTRIYAEDLILLADKLGVSAEKLMNDVASS